MRTPRRGSWARLFCMLAFLYSCIGLAVPSGQTAQPTFRTEANYVRVDVFPTLNGVPVADLRQDEFEVLEDRAPQRIEQFEHVVIRGGGPQDTRREPNTVAESRQALTDPRARVFVLFLDFYHVEVEGSHNIRGPLTEGLNRIIGDDDLVGVMTPEMSPSDITFARKTTTIDGMLARYWAWGERGQINSRDAQEDAYRVCYPEHGPTQACPDDSRGVASEMIARRREKLTMDALQDLVRFLRGVREERKAILAITDGWLLFRENRSLMRRLDCQVPGTPRVFVDPRSGKITTQDPNGLMAGSMLACDTDRTRLAQIDNEREFRDIIDEANRANASFYPIDPRGLVAFDSPISAPLPPHLDAAMLSRRIDTLRTLAEATDGLAVVNSNDLAGGLRRVVNDLSSYYLLGYYSTGKLDGKFHSITVRVKRPGVQVRARRGYLAPSAAEVTAAAKLAAPRGPSTSTAVGETAAMASAAAAAVSALPPVTRDQSSLRVHVTAGWRRAVEGRPAATFWTVGEVADRIPGSDLDAAVMSAAGEIVATARGRIAPGTTSAIIPLTPTRPIEPGTYSIRVKSQAPSGAETMTVQVTLPASPQPSGAVFVRRGPLTGNKEVPTADLRFRRSEQLRVDVPATESGDLAARLLDRTGKLIPVPVAAAMREDPDGSRWAIARVALVPLAPGDYVIEITGAGGAGGAGGEQTRTLVAFRVVP